jgi:restriction system protein
MAGLVLLVFAVCAGLWLLGKLARDPVLLLLVLAGGGGVIAWRVSARVKRSRLLASERQRQAAVYAQRAQAIETYHGMNARQFEEALAYLCQRDGCPQAAVTGKAGDLGADVVAITPDGRKLVIQAKRYVTGNSVTGPALQKFGGTCYAVHHADIAAVVTTSDFTKQARQYAAMMRITLFDANSLAGWAARNGPPPWLAPAPAPVTRIASRA